MNWKTSAQFESLLVISSCGCLGLAYAGISSLPWVLAGCILAAVFIQPQVRRLRAVDWAVLLVLLLEVGSLLSSRYAANGVSSARVVLISGLFYFLVRILVGRPSQYVLASAIVAVGDVGLACFAVSQFNWHFQELQVNGLSDVVAFRYRLIVPPSPWILGEWFTLLLITLPFAFSVTVFLWAVGRRKSAATSIFPVLAIVTALVLSCSRAVFWGVTVFFISVFAVAAIYRVISLRTAATSVACALCMLAVLVLAENTLYPGVMVAYAGGHTSQARSTEGRLAIWSRSGEVFKRSPLLGVGSGNAPLFLAASVDEDQTTGFASRTFSLPVQLLTEKGIVGIALYLAVLVLAGREAHRKLRNPRIAPQMKLLTCSLVAGVMAVLFRELTYSSLLEHAATAMLFTMSLALLAAGENA